MPRYRVTLHFADGIPFIWEGEARSQYRAEVQAMTAMRKTSNQTVVRMDCVTLD
jgi:hypothetical protein